jgi:predicted  nucleic acid-binding Zn-ribbon protein
MATLSAQITSLEARVRRAVERQLEVETNDPLYAIYQVEITQANSDLKAHKTTLDDLMRRSLSTGRESRERQEAFADLRNLTLDGFWQAEPRVINQLLHRLMGHRRLVVRDGQIIGTTGAPDLRRRYSSD